MELIDQEVTQILHAASHRADELLIQYRDQLNSVTEALLESEELSERELIDVIGPSVHPSPKPTTPPAGDPDSTSNLPATDKEETGADLPGYQAASPDEKKPEPAANSTIDPAAQPSTATEILPPDEPDEADPATT